LFLLNVPETVLDAGAHIVDPLVHFVNRSPLLHGTAVIVLFWFLIRAVAVAEVGGLRVLLRSSSCLFPGLLVLVHRFVLFVVQRVGGQHSFLGWGRSAFLDVVRDAAVAFVLGSPLLVLGRLERVRFERRRARGLQGVRGRGEVRWFLFFWGRLIP